MLRTVRTLFASGVLLVVCPAGVSFAADNPVLEMGTLRFDVDTPGWLVTVSGPDGYHQRTVFQGGDPRISLFANDRALLDGTYFWELRSLGGTTEAPEVRSGHFLIDKGAARLPDESATEREASGTTEGDAGSRPEATAVVPGPIAPMLNHSGDFYIGPSMGLGGRLAFGNDIDGTESLGFGSMLVEEDNIRLRFDDASVLAGFPTRDWQITMNDSSSSGADYFRVEDLDAATRPFRIDGGAATDSIRIDQNGRVGIGTATPGTLLQVAGDATIDGEFTVLSSRDAKESFRDVDASEVLARLAGLPLVEWSYVGQEARHFGPVAEDFHETFRLGRDARSINPLDLAGVALAAVQGLEAEVAGLSRANATSRALLEEREREIAELARGREDLESRVEDLERLVEALVEELDPARAP